MRYDNWDVILFSRESHVPLQEFKTACYSSQDDHGRQLPALTCYINSLPASTPFRISVHSWVSRAKPSAIIESRRTANQRVVYVIQVIVDGARVFHNVYETPCKWPQEIVREKRSIAYHEQQPSHRKPALEFPPFHRDVLMQSSWDARENIGRIKIILSEQLIGKPGSPDNLEYGFSNDIVCFSFQHAPRDILEKAGISWPIRNPLYLPTATEAFEVTPKPTIYTNPVQLKRSFAQTLDTGSHARPSTEALPLLSQFSNSAGDGLARSKIGMWETSINDPLGDPFNDINMVDIWSAQTTKSLSASDASMPDMFSRPLGIWSAQEGGKEKPRPREDFADKLRGDRRVVMAFKEDQFGRIIEALSPPRKASHGQHSSACPVEDTETLLKYRSKVAAMSVPVGSRPTSASLARTAYCPDLSTGLRDVSNQALSSKQEFSARGKENRNPSDNRIPILSAFDKNRVPTPHPLLQGPVRGPCSRNAYCDTNAEMRDPPSRFPSLPGVDRGQQQSGTTKQSPVPAPVSTNSVKSRKEGISCTPPGLPSATIWHDKNLLPTLENPTPIQEQPRMSQDLSNHIESPVRNEQTVKADEPRTFIPGHRSGMSSMERVETDIVREIGSFNAALGASMVEFDELESPVSKRKRQGTLREDRGKSPSTKASREGQLQIFADMKPNLRGGD